MARRKLMVGLLGLALLALILLAGWRTPLHPLGGWVAAGAPRTPLPVQPTAAPRSAAANYLPLIAGPHSLSPTATAVATPSPTATPTATRAPTATPTATPTTAGEALPPGPLTLVTLGDSLTAGDRDDSAAGGGYPRRLLAALQAIRPGSTLLNLGQSGWTSGDLIDGVNGTPGQLDQAVAHLNQANGAKVALVWIGSNDLWYLYEFGPEPMNAAAEQDDLAAYQQHLTTIVAALRATGAYVLLGLMDDQALRPVVANPPNPAEPAFPAITADDRARMSAQVTRYNAALTALAALPGPPELAPVDFYATTIFTDPATLADDGNHPNAAGYDAIAALWAAALAQWLP
jgi:lysophospholipase L1-like esterase